MGSVGSIADRESRFPSTALRTGSLPLLRYSDLFLRVPESYHLPRLFRILCQLRYGRPISRSTLEERHGFLKSLATIMHSDLVRLVWIALPQRHARIGAVLAKNVVDHIEEAELVPVIVVVAHNAPEGIDACFLWRHAFSHVLDDRVRTRHFDVFFPTASSARRAHILIGVAARAN